MSFLDVVREVYKDLMSAITDKAVIKLMEANFAKSIQYTAQNIAGKVKKVENTPLENTPSYMKQFIEWIYSQPEYSRLAFSEIAKVAKREMMLTEILGEVKEAESKEDRIFREVNEIVVCASQDIIDNSSGTVTVTEQVKAMYPLTNEEVYLLAVMIRQEQGLITEDEKAKINYIIFCSNVDRGYAEDIQARVNLAKKIRGYAGNAQALEANSGKDKAETLLKILGEMDEEELEDFLEKI